MNLDYDRCVDGIFGVCTDSIQLATTITTEEHHAPYSLLIPSRHRGLWDKPMGECPRFHRTFWQHAHYPVLIPSRNRGPVVVVKPVDGCPSTTTNVSSVALALVRP